jgi:uncharacterized protein (DUF3820 family)
MLSTEESRKELLEAINYKMPFGKHAGWALLTIPEPYYVWFKKKGFPPGKLGKYMGLMYEIKLNGLENELKVLLRK